METISEQELAERVALLKRFKALLESQRSKFNDYLNVLESQSKFIKEGNIEAVQSHTELGNQILNQLSGMEKVIQPIEKMYRDAYPQDNSEIPVLKTDLKKLREKVQYQNKLNRDLMEQQMLLMKNQMKSFANPYNRGKSVYNQSSRLGGIVDIRQ